jgi:16S rRNA (adenine1518-N6/adenine1519-N6)-dimethyltransferase
MIKRKLLGQHFLNSQNIAQSIITEAEITKKDVVFELGRIRRINSIIV